jgi:hypothetical protein
MRNDEWGTSEDMTMLCVICKKGEVRSATVEVELKVGSDRLLVPVQAEACVECSEPYYSMETMQCLEQVRADFLRRAITLTSVGNVYQIS